MVMINTAFVLKKFFVIVFSPKTSSWLNNLLKMNRLPGEKNYCFFCFRIILCFSNHSFYLRLRTVLFFTLHKNYFSADLKLFI
jgi:hypothetical protein